MRKRRREREELEAGMMTPVEPRRITPMDVQQKEFRLSFRGYNEREVDEFLDAVTEELARLHSENVRIRSQLENREREARAAQVEAEATLRRAREEAARMLDDAEQRARSVRTEVTEDEPALEEAPSVGSFLKKNSMVQAIRPFLGREREFLQSMARLIQEHADSVREEVRQIREVPGGQVQEEAAGHSAESERTALPAQMEGEAGPPAAEPELPRRTRKRGTEPESNTPGASAAGTRERAIPADRRTPREAEDGRRSRGRSASAPAPAPGQAGRGSSKEPVWPGSPESGPEDVFQPRRRVARPPVSRLEDEASAGARPLDEQDLPMTQPFEPFRFNDRSLPDPSLEGRESGEEDERSLRELFWGEE